MKTGWKFAIAGVLILGSQFALRVCATNSAPDFAKSTLTVTTGDGTPHKFLVEIARTRAEQEYGLMFRHQIADESGMIFIWPKPIVIDMWMKNTYIPLDMVFLDPAGTVTHVVADAQPESLNIISSVTPAAAVIEIKGGEAAKLGIVAGDKVDSKDLADTYPAPAP